MKISIGKTSETGTTPPTDCMLCIHAEQSALDNVWCTLTYLWAGRCPHSPGLFTTSIGAMLGSASGMKVTTWYDTHLENWVRDGHYVELTRMLRHVRD